MNFTGKCDDILSVEKIEIICENFVYPNSRAGMRGSLRGGQLKRLINTYLAQLHRNVQKNPVIYMDSVMRYSCTTFVLGIPS